MWPILGFEKRKTTKGDSQKLSKQFGSLINVISSLWHSENGSLKF